MVLDTVLRTFRGAIADVGGYANALADGQRILRSKLKEVKDLKAVDRHSTNVEAFFSSKNEYREVSVRASLFRKWFENPAQARAVIRWLFEEGLLVMGQKRPRPAPGTRDGRRGRCAGRTGRWCARSFSSIRILTSRSRPDRGAIRWMNELPNGTSSQASFEFVGNQRWNRLSPRVQEYDTISPATSLPMNCVVPLGELIADVGRLDVRCHPELLQHHSPCAFRLAVQVRARWDRSKLHLSAGAGLPRRHLWMRLIGNGISGSRQLSRA